LDYKKGADGAFFDFIQKENCFDLTGNIKPQAVRE